MTQTTTQANAPSTCKAVVFDAAGCRFALPLSAIGRIIHRSLLRQDPKVKDLLYFENEPLEVVDLGRLLGQKSSGDLDFFVITEVGQHLAIAAEAPPVMMELPLDGVHGLPTAYQQSLQGLAQQMILVNEADSTSSIFLLNLQQLSQLAVKR
jgi:chemotaxis signal transduction protein